MNDLKNNLAQLITRGGIYYNVPGSTRQEIMSNVIGNLHLATVAQQRKFPAHSLPSEKNDMLLQAIMEREALISTGIEKGIALPHPRTPVLEDGEEPFVAIAFPHTPLDWGTPDGSHVHTIFLIVSESSKQHLDTLLKINFLCQQEDFYRLISANAPKDEIIAAIEKAENSWVHV